MINFDYSIEGIEEHIMGNYLNPDNSGFAAILKTPYVDKSGLISLINRTIGTKQMLTCISSPRRFGKSFAAQMLCAYYDRTCDSSSLFDNLVISKNTQYQEHLNKYDVLYLDMTGIMGETSPADMVSYNIVKCSGITWNFCVHYLKTAALLLRFLRLHI